MMKTIVFPSLQQTTMGVHCQVGFSLQSGSMQFIVYGLNLGLADIASDFIQCFDTFEEKATQQNFDVCHEQILHSYYQATVQPMTLAR